MQQIPRLGLYWEELEVGQTFSGPSMTVSQASIIDFAMMWDMQPFHVDAEAAKDSVFGTLVASGLHSLLLTYRLYLETRLLHGTALAGLGINQLKFHRPLKPDDNMQVIVKIAAKRETKKQDRGIADLALTGQVQGEPCISFILQALVARKESMP
jgi:acyl dehydratase